MPHDQPEPGTEAKIRLAYRAFLLHCWQEGLDGGLTWRFTLVQLGGRRVQHGFARLEEVNAYLQGALAANSSADQASNANGIP